MATDPCAQATALRKARDDLISGKSVIEVDTGDTRIRYGKGDLAALDRRIAELDELCAIQTDGKATRRRHAMGVRFRPY